MKWVVAEGWKYKKYILTNEGKEIASVWQSSIRPLKYCTDFGGKRTTFGTIAAAKKYVVEMLKVDGGI